MSNIVNANVLLVYRVGYRHAKSGKQMGSSFVTTLAEDLREAIPNVKGFSKTNLFYMIRFYRLYHIGEEFP